MGTRAAAIVGGQFGSEGKGLIAAHVAKQYGVHVRVGAANAGHTLWVPKPDQPSDGDIMEKHVMQQLPCAAYANPQADLAIGPGALISPEIFVRELWDLWCWRGGNLPRVNVDPRAHVITPEQIQREQETDLAERIGSTSTIAKEGIGTAAAERVLRSADCVQLGSKRGSELLLAAMHEVIDEPVSTDFGVHIQDVPMWLAHVQASTRQGVLLEGTQGTGLSITTGLFPYCTSRNTTTAGLCADVGFPSTNLDRVILVCRTYPIRVAGNSGPFYKDSEEISWSDIGVDEQQEKTTVTKKVRRVATFSMRQVLEAAYINGATEIALTFADYLEPHLANKTSWSDQQPVAHDLVERIEAATGLPVRYVGTGPHTLIDRTFEIGARAA